MKKKLRILVVDDDPGLLEVTKLVLQSGGHLVTMASSALQALRIIGQDEQSNQFDLVITDCDMPAMNGIELIRTIMHFNPEMICWLWSGRMDREREELAIDVGTSKTFDKSTPLVLLNQITIDFGFEKVAA